ncbi:MAG TPA: hypothetical protein VFF65_06370, partial [Phycisphaerales bacterium]|nr:hypothetical protein [Phycisphaerales bacterium]
MLDHEKLESIARKHRLPAARWDERLADRGGGAALNAARDALRKCAHKARKRLWGDLETASEELERAFLPLTDAQGQRLCAELFTGLGPAARRIWSDAATRPVTINRGHGRRAFRAPTDAALLAAARADLIKSLVSDLDGIDQDGLWLARHAGLFDDGSTSVSSLLAAAIDQGGAPGAAVRDQLIEAAWARDGVCGPTSVGLVALTLCADDAAHAEVLKLLHSAKREEGLRQRIAENADEAHPALFRRLLAEILDQDYLRFSAFANCADIWFGLNWDSAAQKALTEAVEHARTMLDEPGRCARAVKSGTAQETYFALWVAAYTDLRTALPLIAAAAASPSAEKRCAAIDLLTAAGLELGQELACAALSDADLRVCARAVEYFNHLGEHLPRRIAQPDAVFDACEKLHARVPARKKLPPAVWPWDARELLPGAITKAMSVCRTPATTQRMLRHVGSMQPADRAELIAEVAGVRVTGRDTFFVYNFDETKLTLAAPLSPSVRSLLLHAIGDTSPHPAGIAAIILAKEPLQSDEAERWCELLSRKSSHFRARAIARLTALADGALLALATRLTADKDAQRRAAGVELLRTMVQQKRSADKAAAALKAAPDGKGAPSARAARALDLDAADLSRATCFGLVRTPPVYVKPAAPGRSRPTTLRMTDAAWGAVYAYAKLVATNLDKPASLRTDSADTPLIGEVEYSWDLNRFNSEKPLDQQREDFGLIAEVERWLAGRTAADRDADGLELYRAALYIELFNQSDDRPLICKAEQVQRLARRDRVELKKLRDSHVFWVGHWVMAMTR